jgi:monoamine oxidase
MAGLAAARFLHAAGHPVQLLEARSRIGGRVWTDYTLTEHPVELGAEFIHGERAPTWDYVQALNLSTVHWTRTDDALVRTVDGQLIPMHQLRQIDAGFDQTRTWALPPIPPDKTESVANYLGRIGFTPTQLHYVERIIANAWCAPTTQLSALEVIPNIYRRWQSFGTEDHRILEGYATVLNHLAEPLAISLNTVVNEIHWGATGVRVHTQDGHVFSGQRAVITLPVGVLKANRVRFEPELPQSKTVALSAMQMNAALKMVFVFAQPIISTEVSAIYSKGIPPMWWSPSYARGVQQQVWTGFATGNWAEEVLSHGEADALDYGLETLRREIGKVLPSPIATRLVNWRDDPFALGGYSAVYPGGHGKRAVLAEPVENVLFWAGEATAPEAPATVHGAYLSGQAAAQAILQTAR